MLKNLKWLVVLVFCIAATATHAQRNAGQFESAPTGKPGKRIALVIGNNDYKTENNLAPLRNPVNDADDIGATLKGFGFEVVTRKNLDRSQMLDALEQFRLRAGGSEAALFFFAGHGQQERNKNYLMPIDGKAHTTSEVIGTGIDVNEQVLVQLEGSTKIAIVMLDACRTSASGKARGGLHGLAEIERPEGSVIAYATAPNKTAAEISGNGRNGLWTQSLLKAFKGNDLSLDGVLYTASLETRKSSGGVQTPHSNGDDILKKHFRFRVTVDPGPVAVEQMFWESIKDSTDAADFEAYLKKFPKGNYKELAENRLHRIRKPPVPTSAPAPAPTPAPTPAPQPLVTAGKVFRDCPDCPEMVVIPAGRFTMGSPANEKDRSSDEGPQHEVSVKSFALGKTEVTFAQWDACVAAGGCSHRPGDEGWGRGTRPAINVSWSDAQAYVKWLNTKTGKSYRLPSEAEWEYAARAGSTTARPWGNNAGDACRYANVYDATGERVNKFGWETHKCDDGEAKTAPVGKYVANGFGLHDMIGNVWEWVEDCHHDSYSGAPSDGSAWTSGKCDVRVLRGGSWRGGPGFARSARRSGGGSAERDVSSGFRLARMLP